MQYFCIVGNDQRKEYVLQGGSARTDKPRPYAQLPINRRRRCEVWLYPEAGRGHVAHVVLAQEPHPYAGHKPGDLPGRTLVHSGPAARAYEVFIAYSALLVGRGRP